MNVPWSEIVAHRERLLRLASRRCPSRQDAEDAVHEAMLRAATFEGLDRARLGQFLTSVTVRLCADVYRVAERGARAAQRLDVAVEPSPEDLAVAADDAAEIRALLAQLPDSQRNALVDRADGFSVAQISQRHSLSYKATESALSRARARLRVALASGMACVFGAAEFLRRRPAVEAALPMATVAMAVVVLHPFAGAPEQTLDARRRPPAAVVGTAATPAAGALHGRPTPAPAPAPTPEPTRHAPRPTRSPQPTSSPGAGWTVGPIYHGEKKFEEEIPKCVTSGTWVNVAYRIDPTAPVFHANHGCGPSPRP